MGSHIIDDITPYLQQILEAIYGEEVRGSIHDSIYKIAELSDEADTTAKEAHQAAIDAQDSATNSAIAAGNHATAAATSEANAAVSETNAADSATEAAGYLDQVHADAQAAKDAKESVQGDIDLINVKLDEARDLDSRAITSAQTAATYAQNASNSAAEAAASAQEAREAIPAPIPDSVIEALWPPVES